LSCEETTDGQVYECHPLGPASLARAHLALGIFNHEAAVADWDTRTLYLSEDDGNGRLYRFRSAGVVTSITGEPGLDLDNGVLEVLEVDGFANGAYQEDLDQARRLHKVRWVPVQDPHRAQETVRAEIEAATGQGAPGTRFKGGEGLWVQTLPEGRRPDIAGSANPLRAVVFLACKGDNRVYALDIDNDQIEVVFDNEQLIGSGEAPFNDVDNIVVGPDASDGDGAQPARQNPAANPRRRQRTHRPRLHPGRLAALLQFPARPLRAAAAHRRHLRADHPGSLPPRLTRAPCPVRPAAPFPGRRSGGYMPPLSSPAVPD
jgi:hypothetical protein